MQAVLDVQPFRDRRRSSSRHAGGKRPPWVATPTSAVVGLKQSASSTVPTTGTRSGSRPHGRVEQCDHRPLAVREHAARRLPVVRIAREPLGQDQQTLRLRGHRAPARRTEPGRRRRTRPRPRIVGDQEVAVEVDVVAQRRDDAAGGDAEPRLDHAPSITPSPSARAACAIRTASRIPPDFASLMLIPCAISAQPATSPAGGSPRRRRSGSASAPSASRRPRRPPATAARSRRRRAPRAAAAPRAPRRATTTRSRRPAAAAR